MPETLEQAIWATIRYWGLFDKPVTAVEIARALVMEEEPGERRWRGQHVYSLAEVQGVLQQSAWLKTKIATQWGYYFRKGEVGIVGRYLQRYQLAQLNWKITHRVGSVLVHVPLVKGIFVTGSLAIMNTNEESDLDLLVVAAPGRIWLTRLLLLLVTQLTGRRRTHWETKAPDKICLNHYVTEESLSVAPSIRSLYTAMLYTHLIPLYGWEAYQSFQAANATWLKRFVMYPEPVPLEPVQYVRPWRWLKPVKRSLERILQEPLFDGLERWAESIQRRVVLKHTVPGQAGRIALSQQELAFHPDSKAAALLNLYHQDEGQRALW
jgi:predicted nucleotidyltransferase